MINIITFVVAGIISIIATHLAYNRNIFFNFNKKKFVANKYRIKKIVDYYFPQVYKDKKWQLIDHLGTISYTDEEYITLTIIGSNKEYYSFEKAKKIIEKYDIDIIKNNNI